MTKDGEDRVAREEEINDRFGDSRAVILNQLFATLTTSHGVALAAVIGMYSKDISNPLHIPLSPLILLLGLGMAAVLLSALCRFEHSKAAQKQKIAKLHKDSSRVEEAERKRRPLQLLYRGLMWLSMFCFIVAIIVVASAI